MPPFIILGLPRSRTAWLARFLTYGECYCGHEELRHVRSMDDVKSWFAQGNTGSAETGAAPWWRTSLKLAPDARVVVVRRPVDAVVDSLMRLGLFPDRDRLTRDMVRLDRKLDQVEKRVPGVLSVRFADLETEETCARIFEHCLPYKHDPAWWSRLSPVNIQINMLALVRHFQAFKPQMDKVAAQAKWHALDQLAREPTAEPEELSIRTESFDTFYRDATASFSEHLVFTDQHPADYLNKNIGLMRSLDAIDGLQVVTARSNGRVFGYLMSIVGPSMDDPDLIEATHTLFFADPSFKGLGMKLQRFARDALRDRGVGEIIFRAGIRGSGPRVGALYRRLGAQPYGNLFRLKL